MLGNIVLIRSYAKNVMENRLREIGHKKNVYSTLKPIHILKVMIKTLFYKTNNQLSLVVEISNAMIYH